MKFIFLNGLGGWWEKVGVEEWCRVMVKVKVRVVNG